MFSGFCLTVFDCGELQNRRKRDRENLAAEE